MDNLLYIILFLIMLQFRDPGPVLPTQKGGHQEWSPFVVALVRLRLRSLGLEFTASRRDNRTGLTITDPRFAHR